ncbi:MAG: hypothetical protein HN704_00320 [Bacteroidetes bacterium]|jgi:hypothetical protein|nr:hypothetical protein [Bacteroidota bacterium]MBT6687888.1 hypothetical protein [Bacteroidota bacterium]MBT7142464.1 hypothetical protein [Bacteroidota bacterium]MBT7490029.1 hypothetical protein [Bacteroidota bacterium]
MKNIHLSFSLLLIIILMSCSSKEFVKNPVDVLVRDLPSDAVFSIVLYDMGVEGTFAKTYKHQYQIVTEKNENISDTKTDWIEVGKDFFYLHENNMGMEIISRNADGKLNKTASPAGYSNYVGNEKYGKWSDRGGSSFWEFYGKYAMLSSMFHMISYPANRTHWNDYHSNYYGRKSYYGPSSNGKSYYGTYSDNNTKSRSNSKYTNSSNFRNKVQSKVSRSSSTSKTSRSSSRYSSSRSRSRGGGSGK